MNVTVMELAQDLHNSGRGAVEAGATVAAEKFGDSARKFIEWDELSDAAKGGRITQAAYLLGRYQITKPEEWRGQFGNPQ
jgi:hypothetical protein